MLKYPLNLALSVRLAFLTKHYGVFSYYLIRINMIFRCKDTQKSISAASRILSFLRSPKIKGLQSLS